MPGGTGSFTPHQTDVCRKPAPSLVLQNSPEETLRNNQTVSVWEIPYPWRKKYTNIVYLFVFIRKHYHTPKFSACTKSHQFLRTQGIIPLGTTWCLCLWFRWLNTEFWALSWLTKCWNAMVSCVLRANARLLLPHQFHHAVNDQRRRLWKIEMWGPC